MDYKTLFPVLDNGVFFFDILMKHAIRLASRYWQDNTTPASPCIHL